LKNNQKSDNQGEKLLCGFVFAVPLGIAGAGTTCENQFGKFL
jgi:hypothetical protein